MHADTHSKMKKASGNSILDKHIVTTSTTATKSSTMNTGNNKSRYDELKHQLNSRRISTKRRMMLQTGAVTHFTLIEPVAL